MMLLLPLLLGAGGGSGGGGLSAAGPVVLVDGTDRFADEKDEDGESPPTPGADSTEAWRDGTPTPGTAPGPAFYETAEYDAGQWQRPLAVTRFSDAYARGWTGLGSLVTIADTGVDSDHPDLAPGLAHGRDFTGTGLEDTNGHGTHVAGIVGARRDQTGMHGGAFDAELAIAKVAAGWIYDFGLARAATAWGRDLGSVAVNEASADATFGASDSFDKIDFRLALNVTRFAYVPGGEAMVDFDATVNTSTGDVLLARSYWGRAPLAGEAPADGVNALGVALGEAMTVFAGELATTLPAGQD